MTYEIKTNDKGYSKIISFLSGNGFGLKVRYNELYWINGNQKIKPNSDKFTLNIVSANDFVKKRLEEIASNAIK